MYAPGDRIANNGLVLWRAEILYRVVFVVNVLEIHSDITDASVESLD